MRKLVWVVAPLFFAAAPISAEIFKCPGKSGASVYQNFPCPIDSLGSLPSNPTIAPVPTPASGANPTTQKPGRVEGSTDRPIVAQSEPRIGMTADEVRAIWGEPISAYGDELVEGRVDIWTYGDTRSVKFDVNGRVAAVQR